MHETELELLARHLAEGLRGDHDIICRELVRLLARGRPVTPERLASAVQMTAEQEDLCRPIVQQITRGKPVTPAALRASLQVRQPELEHRLAKLPPDVEFDGADNIVGLGVTLVPTSHRVQVGGKL